MESVYHKLFVKERDFSLATTTWTHMYCNDIGGAFTAIGDNLRIDLLVCSGSKK